MLVSHENFDDFFHALSNPTRLGPWKGHVVRQSAPRWLSRPYRFTGVGSVLVGGRWNVQRLMPAIYASTQPDTLNAEAYYKGRRYGWSQADFKPQLIIGMNWELQAVLDLTDSITLDALHVKNKELVKCEWNSEQRDGNEPLTQAIARAAFENMAEGLVVPSARSPSGVNIVYFPTHRRRGSVIQTLDEANIPFIHGL